MHENFWSFTPTHKFAIAANHMPSIVGQDSGIWRRLAFVPWEYTIPEKDRKPEFEKYLFNNEASGILNWLIEGLKKYRQQGLAIPDKIKDSSQKVKDSSDWLSEFWGETLTTETKPGYLEENTRIRASQVYDLYKRWASANGIVVLPSSKAIPLFTKRVEDLGLIAPKPGNVRWYIGVRTKDESDHDTEIDKKLDENKNASSESAF
jgi:putative DNA primase/helicase